MDKNLNINQIKKMPFSMASPPVKVGDNQSDISSIAYDPEGKFLAVGAYDGAIKIYSPFTGKQTQVINPSSSDSSPISCLRWRPVWSGPNLKPSSVLTSISSNGHIQHWHPATNKVMNDIPDHMEKKNNLYALDYLRDGRKYAVAGLDRKIYVYDSQTKDLVCTMLNKGLKVSGHINRVYCIKSHPEDKNLLVSSGWDGMLKIYDIRDKAPVASMGGSQVSGDSLDIYDDMIVAGSYRTKDVMQIYSFSQRKKVHNFEYYQGTNREYADSGNIFSTRFSNDGNFIFAGGAGKNELKVFANNSDTKADFKIQCELKDLPSPVYTLDVNPNPNMKQFTFGLGNGNVYMCNYEVDTKTSEFTPYMGEFQKFAIEKIQAEQKAEQKLNPGIGTFLTRPTVNGQQVASIY